MSESQSKRFIQIETLRGLACILLVFYHAVGPIDGGLRIEAGSVYRLITDALVHIRMPLFTCISGFIYSLYAARDKSLNEFVLGKARRLLLPLVFVGTPIALMQALGPGVNKSLTLRDALFSALVPVNHFWFLQAIFIIFCVVAALKSYRLLEGSYRFAAVCLAAVVLFLCVPGVRFFSLNNAIYLAPFFLTGMAIQRYYPNVSKSGRVYAAIGALALVVFELYLAANDRQMAIERRSTLGLIVGVTACVLLYGCGFKSALLSLVGGHSFAIYLFHTVFTVGVRVMLTHAGVSNINIFVGLELLAGLALPIALALTILRSPLLALLLLGEARKTKLTAVPASR